MKEVSVLALSVKRCPFFEETAAGFDPVLRPGGTAVGAAGASDWILCSLVDCGLAGALFSSSPGIDDGTTSFCHDRLEGAVARDLLRGSLPEVPTPGEGRFWGDGGVQAL